MANCCIFGKVYEIFVEKGRNISKNVSNNVLQSMCSELVAIFCPTYQGRKFRIYRFLFHNHNDSEKKVFTTNCKLFLALGFIFDAQKFVLSI